MFFYQYDLDCVDGEVFELLCRNDDLGKLRGLRSTEKHESVDVPVRCGPTLDTKSRALSFLCVFASF